MNVATLHEAEHCTGHATHLQSFKIKRTSEGIERPHNVSDGTEAVLVGVRSCSGFRLSQDFRIGFLDHLLAEIDANEIVLENVVVEHVFGGFAEIDDPFRDVRRSYSERHILRVGGAGGVVVTADAADTTGDEMSIARILPLHENTVSPEDGGGAVTLSHFLGLKVDLGEDAQAADDAGNRIPIHLH